MSWKVSDVMSQRMEFVSLASVEGANFAELCRRYEVSRKTGYKWLQRYRQHGQAGLEEQSRKPLAFLPERFMPPYYLNGRDFLKYILKLQGLPYQEAPALEMLAALDLDAAALSRPVRAYSKGMTQKLGLASCFLANKAIYVLDEPMSGLDPKARALLKAQLTRQREAGRTLFFSSHALADVEEICDRMAILHQGELRYVGSPAGCREQFGAATLEQAYLTCIA